MINTTMNFHQAVIAPRVSGYAYLSRPDNRTPYVVAGFHVCDSDVIFFPANPLEFATELRKMADEVEAASAYIERT